MKRNKLVRKGIDLAAWLRGGLMEQIVRYEPNVLDNEVPVFRKEMDDLFENHKVYVFGYGSLLYADGWWGRGMRKGPTDADLKECVITGYERGPWGLYNYQNFYGVIPTNGSKVNGCVARIHSLGDWVGLMSTEMIAGLYSYANYRVVDVTGALSGVKLPKGSRVHCVCNRPINRTLIQKSLPYYRYYDRVWKNAGETRSPDFIKQFLETGGFRCDEEVYAFMERRKTNVQKASSKHA